MSILGSPWKYISEGNVHIVLQVLGTDYVLRLTKEDEKITDLNTIRNSITFVNLVMLPLLRSSISQLELIKIPDEELELLSTDLLKIRPEHRRHKSKLNPSAIKAPNLTILSSDCKTNYCVEIKPKSGLMTSCFAEIGKCYFCLKQFLKLEESLIQSTSNYCPLDLFSGDRIRMKTALSSLIENPQNNFKMFLNGTLIFNEKSIKRELENITGNIVAFKESPDTFLDFIVEALLSNDQNPNTVLQKTQQSPENRLKDTKKCVQSEIHLNNAIFLHNLLSLQSLHNGCCFDVNVFSEDPFDYVPKVVENVQSKNLELSTKCDRETFFSSCHPNQLALLSAIFKDCSIMICFSPTHHETFPSIQIGENKLSYRVSVTDLEPKPVTTLLKRRKTEKKLLEIYKKYIKETDPQCKIQPHTETRTKQLEAWQQLIADYLKANKLSTIDVRESQNSPLFNNTAINRKLTQEAILTILDSMAAQGRAAPSDKSRTVWEVYWHSLDEWGNMVYSWAASNGLNNSVCTLFELREGDNTVGEEFHGLDMNVLMKALKALEAKGKCELMEFDDSQGVKFF